SPTKDVVGDWSSTNYTVGNFFANPGDMNVLGVGSIALAANTITDIAPLTVTIGSSMNNLQMIWWTEGQVEQDVTLEFRPQLELGDEATEYENISKATAIHHARRWYQKTFAADVAPVSNVGHRYGALFCSVTNNTS